MNELGFNCRVKPFSDVRVRQAIAMALDKNEIAKAATYGQGGPARTMVAPASPIKVNVKPLPYDPTRAKALLAEAGYPNGFSFSFSPCGGTAFPDMQLASELIAYQLQAIGINATAPTMEAGVWADNVITKHHYQGFICGLVSGLDPDQHLYRYFRSDGLYNFSQYASTPTLDRLLLKGARDDRSESAQQDLQSGVPNPCRPSAVDPALLAPGAGSDIEQRPRVPA